MRIVVALNSIVTGFNLMDTTVMMMMIVGSVSIVVVAAAVMATIVVMVMIYSSSYKTCLSMGREGYCFEIEGITG